MENLLESINSRDLIFNTYIQIYTYTRTLYNIPIPNLYYIKISSNLLLDYLDIFFNKVKT